MVKKPLILTDDGLDAGLPGTGTGDTPPPLPHGRNAPPSAATAPDGVTRPLDAPELNTAPDTRVSPASPDMADAVGTPDAAGRDASGHARPKTRIHGYGGSDREARDTEVTEAAPDVAPVVGWLVVTAGPGRGAAIGLVAGMNSVGRGDENAAQVDFGDDTISRAPHAFVTYDDEKRQFHLTHGGKTNLVRLNDAPVLATEDLSHGDTVRIGATSLRFVALCGPDFDWSDT